MKQISSKYFYTLFFLICFGGCLDDRLTPELNFQVENSVELLVFLESQGDYINSEGLNEFISAAEVFANRSTYLIIDVRPENEFIRGYIENAVNVKPENLLAYVRNKGNNNYSKIIIVSESGQAAAYYNGLLRFAGCFNTFSMEYGMAAWHKDFADIWLNAVRDFGSNPDEKNYFTNTDYPKPAFSSLPNVSVQNHSNSVQEKLESRINSLLAEGFYEKPIDILHLSNIMYASINDELSSITTEALYSKYNNASNSFSGYYIICFGDNFLYKAHSMQGPFAGQGHLPSAVQYIPLIDLRSSNYLQTIPYAAKVVVYDVNGHKSAKVAAYLRVLGYDAKSLLFGANNLFYSRLNFVESLRQFAFNSNLIMNYPYITGN